MTGSDPLRFHRRHRDQGDFGDGLIQRAVSWFAEAIGTPVFLLFAIGIIVAWIVLNGGYAYFSHAWTALEHGRTFDKAPWILLNLIFSFEAFFTGSLVVIAAKAQARRQLQSEEADARHREELAKLQMQMVAENTALTEKIHRLTTEVHKAIADRPSRRVAARKSVQAPVKKSTKKAPRKATRR